MCVRLTSSAETLISFDFSSASCLMNFTICSICFSTCTNAKAHTLRRMAIPGDRLIDEYECTSAAQLRGQAVLPC